jgi:hypothetical protein
MAARIFLALNVLAWLPYGLFCLARPGFLEGAAGVAFTSPTGSTELRAMYGGLQAAIGVRALCGLLLPALRRPALIAVGFLTAGLATGRAFGALVDGEISGYTALGLTFEVVTAVVAAWIVSRGSAPVLRTAEGT